MSDDSGPAEGLPVHGATHEQRVILVRSLLVEWNVLEHLQRHDALGRGLAAMRKDGCCKPDGGSCCVNKRLE